MTEADSLPHEGTGPLRAVGSREQHLGALFEMVLTRGPLSRRDAARLTGLSAASVTKLVKPMLNHGYLVENHREAGVPNKLSLRCAVSVVHTGDQQRRRYRRGWCQPKRCGSEPDHQPRLRRQWWQQQCVGHR